MGHVVHLPLIPQHPRTPGHKAFRSQLTANELGGIRFAGVGSKWSTVQPRSARANPLWQPRALGIWGRYLPTRSHTYRGRRMPMGVTSNWCHPQGHHARRPPTTVPPCIWESSAMNIMQTLKNMFLKYGLCYMFPIYLHVILLLCSIALKHTNVTMWWP